MDCGEGTQFQLLKYRLQHTKISHIFISHLHGDHYLGLIGLISSMHLWGRKKELVLFSPPGLGEIITVQLKVSQTVLNYPLILHEIDAHKAQTVLELEDLTVESIPLDHRIECCGYLFKEKEKNHKIIKEKLPDDISLQDIALLKKGKDILDEQGKVKYFHQDYTLPPKKRLSYAYCSDTAYKEDLIPQLKGVDTLYHEATFGEEMIERARDTHHSTARQAGTLARKAEVGQLVIGHFSARYRDVFPLWEEAKAEFPNTVLANEGALITVHAPESNLV